MLRRAAPRTEARRKGTWKEIGERGEPEMTLLPQTGRDGSVSFHKVAVQVAEIAEDAIRWGPRVANNGCSPSGRFL